MYDRLDSLKEERNALRRDIQPLQQLKSQMEGLERSLDIEDGCDMSQLMTILRSLRQTSSCKEFSPVLHRFFLCLGKCVEYEQDRIAKLESSWIEERKSLRHCNKSLEETIRLSEEESRHVVIARNQLESDTETVSNLRCFS